MIFDITNKFSYENFLFKDAYDPEFIDDYENYFFQISKNNIL